MCYYFKWSILQPLEAFEYLPQGLIFIFPYKKQKHDFYYSSIHLGLLTRENKHVAEASRSFLVFTGSSYTFQNPLYVRMGR